MTTIQLRQYLRDRLLTDGWQITLEGPTGEYFERSGECIKLGWPFDGRPVPVVAVR